MKNWKKKTVLFLISQAITLFGSSIVQFAMVWYVTLKTSSGFWVSLLTICAYLPQFLISFVAGVWADRYSRKKLIIVADASIATATLILALLIPHITGDTLLLTLLMVVSAIRSIGAGIQTPAVSAMIPQLVPEEHLMRFNGMNSTVQSIVQFAAPAAAGAILTISTLGSALYIDVATAVVGIGILSCIVLPKQINQAPKEEVSLLKELVAGVKYATTNKFLGKILILNGIFIFLCVPAGFLAALYVNRTFGEGYIYLTIVELVGFAGMMGGGILMFTYGIALTMIQTATTTLLQEQAKPEMQGRVFGLFGAIYSGFLPLGMLVFGPMADIIPMHWIMIGSGVLLILVGIITSQKLSLPKNK